MLDGDVLRVIARAGSHCDADDIREAPRYLLSALADRDREAIHLARQLARHPRRRLTAVRTGEA